MPTKLLEPENNPPAHKSKHAVSKRLRELAFKRGPDIKLPTTRELCELLETSPRTLNDALEELELQNVIYRKPRNGIFVSQRLYQKNIALLMGACVFQTSGRSPFWDVLWGCFIREAQKRNHALGETFSIHAVLRKESPARPLDEQVARMIERRQIDGILCVGLDNDTCDWMRDHDLPIVAYAGNGIWVVAVDNGEAVRLGAAALIAQGCRDIRLWLVGDNHPPHPGEEGYTGDAYQITRERQALREVMDKHGLVYNDQSIYNNRSLGKSPYSHQEQGARAVDEMLDRGDKMPDGLVITDDMMTVGTIKALQKRGIRPGIDIKIASHVNKGIPVLDAFSDTITQIEVDPETIVQTMFETLDFVLSGGQPDDYLITMENYRLIMPGESY